MEGVLTSDRFSVYRTVLAGVGAAYLLRLVLKTLCSLAGGFRGYFLAPWGISRINLTKYGSWAIVTGASEGIGRAYALELAKHGLNIVIMSRSEDKLRAVAEEIRSKYNREVRDLAVDFTQGQSVYDDVQAEISDLDVAVLVNNVGLSLTVPNLTGDVDEERHRNIIELNCQSMVQMTHLVLPKMVEKKKGIIVNLSSVSSLSPSPMLNVYAATKKFVQYFSDALRYEYRSQGIVVQTVYPGFVATAMSGIRRPKYWAPSPERYAKTAVATIGVQNDTYGYLYHAVQSNLTLLLPQWFRLFATYKFLSGARKIWLKKQARKKE